jgi:hypothetical protein
VPSFKPKKPARLELDTLWAVLQDLARELESVASVELSDQFRTALQVIDDHNDAGGSGGA